MGLVFCFVTLDFEFRLAVQLGCYCFRIVLVHAGVFGVGWESLEMLWLVLARFCSVLSQNIVELRLEVISTTIRVEFVVYDVQQQS